MPRRETNCPACGKYWPPSLDESESFPGSGCDLGVCAEGLDDVLAPDEDRREDSFARVVVDTDRWLRGWDDE